MAMLESTPYRVYYLLNTSDNNQVFNPVNWDESDNSIDSDKKVIIHARFDKNNDFYSVVVVSVVKSESHTYDYYYVQEANEDYRQCKWDDIDEDIVDIVNRYYSKREKDRIRIIEYADRIQAMYENPDRISFTVGIDGQPRLSVTGLPYIRDGKVLDMDLTLSTLNESYYNICLNDNNPEYKNSSCSVTNDELREVIEKAKKYDQLRDRIIRMIDYPDDDQRIQESMMYTPYNPRW